MQGYFDDKNKEYVITDMFPRREWLNYLWNNTTVCGCDQFGFGTSWSVMGKIRRPIEGGERNLAITNGERNVYIKDSKSGEIYSANRNYNRLPFSKHQCHVGIGYQKVVSEYNGLEVEFTVFVPTNGNVTQFLIKAKNNSKKTMEKDLYFCTRIKVENGGHEAYTSADFCDYLNGIYYKSQGFKMPHEYTDSFMVSSQKVDAFDVCKDNFLGHYGFYNCPEGIKNKRLSCKGSTFESDYIGAFQYAIKLEEGEEWCVVITCGFGKDKKDCIEQGQSYLSDKNFYEQLNLVCAQSADSFDVFKMKSPDEHMDSMANIWLKRQLSLGKTWGRLYGKGFRDVMQDIAAFVSLDVDFARKCIVNVLKHQYEDGNPIRMFEPDYKSPYNDSSAWIPATVLAYIKESGDLSVLEEKAPYIKGDSYENAEYDVIGFFSYDGTQEEYTVLDHLKRAMEYLYSSRGEHGLVLFRAGDWNDSMNNVGRQEKGESVWLTIATVKAYAEFIEILKYVGEIELTNIYSNRVAELKENIIKYGFDGKYFIYGYNDFGEKIGSPENEYAKIFLNPQTWAVLANIFDEERLHDLMDIVEEKLSCDYGYVQCAPSYEKGCDKIGRVSYFQKGLIENGGVYNHGVAFKIVADCILKRGDIAYNTWRKIAYDNPLNPNNGMEPYVVSNMYIGPECDYLKGFAPMSWVTGTAGWLYRCITEYMCGIQADINGLKICPCFPKEWSSVKVKRKFRKAIYNITFERGEENKIIADGKTIDGIILPLLKEGEECNVLVLFK